ncbi:MAG: putative phosphosugar-binding protein [Saprospiraceae bacterium]
MKGNIEIENKKLKISRMSYTKKYLEKSREIVDVVAAQEAEIQKVAALFAASILKGRLVHVFGSGHSRMMVEEMWPRYGSFPGFNPIVELSLSFHNLVVGANGQRQAMFLENVSGLADRILRNFDITEEDTALIVSSSGCNVVPIEMAEELQKKGVKVAALVSSLHLEGSTSKRSDSKKLIDFADYVLNTGAPLGDAMLTIEGMDTPVSPGSTLGGVMIVNSLKAEIAALLLAGGKTPKVLTSGKLIGDQRATDLFEAAYDEHAHNMAKLYENVGNRKT